MNRSRVETKAIIKQFARDLYHSDFTIGDVCRRLDRKVSPNIRNILAELVQAGDLYRRLEKGPNGYPRWIYTAWNVGTSNKSIFTNDDGVIWSKPKS